MRNKDALIVLEVLARAIRKKQKQKRPNNNKNPIKVNTYLAKLHKN